MRIVSPPPDECNPPPAVGALAQAAAFYASLGYRILPVRPNSKIAAIKDWQHAASSDPVHVATWWAANPAYNIGLLADGLLIVDVDGSDNAWLKDQPERLAQLQTAPTQATPRGGRHFIFRAPGGTSFGPTAGKLAEHVDTRSGASYILLSPSVVDGKPYGWIGESGLVVNRERLPVAFGWLVDTLGQKRTKPTNGTRTNGTAPPRRAGAYASKAIEAECQRVASASEGTRNHMLNRAAFSLGQLVGAGAADRATVEAELRLAADAAGLGADEVEATLRSGIEAGIAGPRQIPERPAAAVEDDDYRPGCDGMEPGAGGEPQPERPAQREFNRTDMGNAERLVAEHGHDLRYCHGLGWLAWDGRRWKPDATGEAQRRAKRTARRLFREAVAGRDEDLFKHAVKTESAPRIDAMLKLASTEATIAVAADALDADQWLLNVHNGTLDLRTGTLRPHSQRDLITKLADVAFDPTATAPRWAAFLERIFAGDAELIGFAQRAAGSALAGAVREHVLHVLYGIGSNGKSRFLEALRGLLGDYGGAAAPKLLMKRNNDAHPTELADLRGKRFIMSVETGEGGRLDEEKVKALTGSDRVKARYMRQDFFEFGQTWTVLLATNHQPAIQGGDLGIWRRVKLWPFTVVIPDHEQDPGLDAKLTAERPGVLNWALAGCLSWQRDGLGRAASVAQATSEYRESQDTLGAWLWERCIVEAGQSEGATLLYQNYSEWAKTNGEFAVSGTRFGKALGERGFGKRKTGGIIVRDGLRLRAAGDI